MTASFGVKKIAYRRVNTFQRKYGSDVLRLAYHAALPVVLDPHLLHLLRINFFLDPPEILSYRAETDLLLSPLCEALGDGLYEIKPYIRDVLLQGLVTTYGTERVRAVATLLWQYSKRHSPWADRVELDRAQQLTVMSFLDPHKARQWLEKAENEAGPVMSMEWEWFVAMRRELKRVEQTLMQPHNVHRPDGTSDERSSVSASGKAIPQSECDLSGDGEDLPTKAPVLFEESKKQALALVEQALHSLLWALDVYQRDYEQTEQALRDVRGTGAREFDDSVLERKDYLSSLRKKIDHASTVMHLLQHMQQELQDEKYKEVLFLSMNRLLGNSGDDVSGSIAQQVEHLAQTLQSALDDAVRFARELGQLGSQERTQAQKFLENEVLRRYSNYPQARELQRDWERETIKRGVDEDENDYTKLVNQTETLWRDFWSGDKGQPAGAEVRARAHDLAAMLISPGLERAREAIERLEMLGASGDSELQGHRDIVQERQMRRWVLRLRIALYRNNSEELEYQIRLAQQMGVPLEALESLHQERQAIDAVNKALEYFEIGDWVATWNAILPARTIKPRASRIITLIKRLQEATETEVELEGLLQEVTGNLLALERDSSTNDVLLKQANQHLIAIGDMIDPYTYFRNIYEEEYRELTQRYLHCWQTFTTRILDGQCYRQEQAVRLVEQYKDLIEIAPRYETVQPLIAKLKGRVLVINTQQAIYDSCLRTAAHLLDDAAHVLPPDDQPFKDAQDSLRKKQNLVRLNYHQAVYYQQQYELSKAYKCISEALKANREDVEAAALKTQLEIRMALPDLPG